MIKYILVLLIAISSLQLFASTDTLRPSFLIGASYGINLHSGLFQSAAPCCTPNFDFVSGKGFNFQVGYIYKNSNTSTLDLILSLQNYGGDFSKNEIQPIAYNNTSIDGTIQHRMKANLQAFTFQALYSYNLFSNVFVKIGPSAGYFLTKNEDLIEEIISPSDRGYFKENGKRTRNEQTGFNINGASLRMGLDVGLSFNSLPLNSERTLLAHPFINYSFGLTSTSSEFTWRIAQLAFGLNVAYSPFEQNKINREIQQIDTVKIKSDIIEKSEFIAGVQSIKERTYESKDTTIYEKLIVRSDTLFYPNPNKVKPKLEEKEREELIASLKVIGYDGDKELGEVKEVKLNVELSREIYPLLPYIFFDEKQSQLPSRYAQMGNLKDFSPMDLNPSPTVYHRNILKILASRMLENPDAKISLTGYVDPTTESDMCDLAYERASQVKQLLVDRFGIADNRISLNKEATCYPKDLTRSATLEGYEENRRVEIGTNKPEVLFAVVNARYQNPTLITPTKIVAEPFSVINKIKGDDVRIFPPANWNLEVYQGKTNFLSHQSASEVIAMPISITKNNAKLLNNVSPLTINFTAYDNKGQAKVVKKEIRVQKDTSLIEIESLTLTVFQVSQYTLDNRIKKEIEKFISKLDANSTISIRGYSDNLGNAENNKSLSQVRANEVRDFIKQTASTAKIIEVVGLGSDKFAPGVTSYASPEERFISRTVEIKIKKTLEK